jgi:hypothetical protein
MCNLYSITTNQAAISVLFRVVNRYVGNLAPMPGVFPDYKASIIRTGADGRELATARWGMPSSSMALMDATKKRPKSCRPRASRSMASDFDRCCRKSLFEPWAQILRAVGASKRKFLWGESSSDSELTDDLRNGAQGPSNGDFRLFCLSARN